MKRSKRWPMVLATILVIGIGAAMPWAAAWVQDLYGVSSQETLPFDPVSLTLQQDSEIGAVLRLMSSPYDETEWPGETRLTEEEASNAALGALAQLDQYGLLESGSLGEYGSIAPDIVDQLKASGGSNATPAMFISLDGATAIIWVCHWKGITGPSYELLIDDATGKAVIGYIPTPPPEDEEAVYRRIERWRNFFQDYYGLTVETIEDLGGDIFSQFLILLDLGDGEGGLGMLINTFYYEMDFLPCAAEVTDNPPLNSLESDYIALPTLPGPYDANYAN